MSLARLPCEDEALQDSELRRRSAPHRRSSHWENGADRRGNRLTHRTTSIDHRGNLFFDSNDPPASKLHAPIPGISRAIVTIRTQPLPDLMILRPRCSHWTSRFSLFGSGLPTRYAAKWAQASLLSRISSLTHYVVLAQIGRATVSRAPRFRAEVADITLGSRSRARRRLPC